MQLIAVLPNPIDKWIQAEARSRRDADNLTRLSKYVLGKYVASNTPFEEYIEISTTHFRNQVGTHYHGDLLRMISAGIIRANNEYYYHVPNARRKAGDKLGRCKSYQIAPDYVFADPVLREYNDKASKHFDNDQVTRATVNLLSKLKLDLDKRSLVRYVNAFVSADYVRGLCKIGEEIPPGSYYASGIGNTPRNLRLWLELATKHGKTAILYRDKIYIEELDSFLSRRQQQIRYTYLESLTRLKQIRKRVSITCKRNTTNYRLDTNLTNLKSDFLGLLRLDGERLVSIDLSNSQFTILSWVIDYIQAYLEELDRKYFSENCNINRDNPSRNFSRGIDIGGIGREIVTNIDRELLSHVNVTQFITKNGQKSDITLSIPADLIEFQKLTQSGQFYDNLAELLSRDSDQAVTRAEAKRAMFLAAFSSNRYNPPIKKALTRYYPSLVRLMDQYKRNAIEYLRGEGLPERQARNQGDAALAVMLQRIESALFIDKILSRLLSEGYRVFTKHDSILCKESELDQVLGVVREELDSFLGAGMYRLSIEKT